MTTIFVFPKSATSLGGPPSLKAQLNVRIDEKFVRTAQRLSNELEILGARDDGFLGGALAVDGKKSTNILNASAQQQESLKQSIEEIIDIRESLGIETPKGQNKPLEDLFRLDENRGSLLNTQS